uniref:Uncharacterized protein n=1 Tax=Lotus japonicus TaxID=34305 RepID=I3SB37_LOTJA|nr:unknown [Lotus japonicus]
MARARFDIFNGKRPFRKPKCLPLNCHDVCIFFSGTQPFTKRASETP